MSNLISVQVDTKALEQRLGFAVTPDDKLMLYMHQQFAKYCEPYVPKESGTLAQTVDITPNVVEWKQPYAHYQYVGEIYGPNIPIRDKATGTIIGSQPGVKKKPTGRPLTYSQEVNPNATDHWDVPAMAAHMEDLLADIGNFITKRINGGGQVDI